MPPPATAVLLGEVEQFLERFIALPSEDARIALALFGLHTWAIDAAYVTPYIVLGQPERRSGKTRHT